MYFKRLEIIGFKSFLNRTILNFEPGITAVVGPNGCGKSNIFDSIRWVLGEQSVKSLRGSEMQDVIFNGTDAKEPLSMAEVTVTFDNKKRHFPVEHDEVSLTRRIFRSGECEYLLNKTVVRLKDILDLLMGTGIGAESYSLVAQGKIDLILSSRPEDRRLVFDEAAGITKYKTQKREALRRLDETEQNLLRVNDIVNEVKRQIASLERQANKARRYKEAFEELKGKEISFALLQKGSLLKEQAQLSAEVGALQEKELELTESIRELEAKIANRQAELKALENEMLACRNEVLSLDNLVSKNKERIDFNREKIAELDAQKTYLKEQLEQTTARLKGDEEKLNNVRREYEGIRSLIEQKTAAVREGEAELEKINSLIRGSHETISRSKREILDLVSRIAQLRNTITDMNSKQQILTARRKRLEIEKAKIAEEKFLSGTALEGIRREVESLAQVFQEMNRSIEGMQEGLKAEGATLEDLRRRMQDLEKQKLSLESKKEFLDRLRAQYEDISESMNAVIYLDKLPAKNTTGLVVRIKDCAGLSDEDKAYFDPASFKLSGEAKPIDLDTREIAAAVAGICQEIASLGEAEVASEAKISDLERRIQEAVAAARSHEMVLVNKRTQQEAAQEQFNKIKEEEDLVGIELSDVTAELGLLEAKIKEETIQLESLEKDHRDREDTIVAEQNSITQNSALKEKALVSLTQMKTELESLTRRIASDEATLKLLEDTYRQDNEVLSNLNRQVEESGLKQDALLAEIAALEENIIAAHKTIAKQQEALAQVEARYQEVSGRGSDVAARIEEERRALEGARNKLHELQMRNKDVEFKYASLRERILQNYKFDLDAPAAEGTQQLPESGADIDALALAIEELKKKLDSYGTVNLVAIEEYDELKKRYDFLSQQQTDLLTAKESLHEAILKINRTTKQMFMETFEKVRGEFRNYFRLLFNGGDAQVFLVDEQDPLESGIEIICRPPGKKLQNVLLLSGGEKSMAAIALIFAIFKVKPSPFCVLDEIDAALDEANVDRFGRMLQEFANISQFIVITHNKKTIANADVMYGITMEESGVSKIVSVKFSKEKKPQPVPAPQEEGQVQEAIPSQSR